MTAKRSSARVCFGMTMIILIISGFFLFFTAYFRTHFYPGTTINETKVSCLTAREADRKLNDQVSSYVLVLNERDNVRELIKGSEIGLRFDTLYGCAFYKRNQNQTIWFLSFLRPEAIKYNGAYAFDESSLKKRCLELDCINKEKVVEPKNAGLVFMDGVFQIVPEIYGNKINEELLYAIIRNSAENGKTNVYLEEMNCYINPTIKWDSQKVLNTKLEAERYLVSKVVYQYNGGSEIVDQNDIGSWIEFDDHLNISFSKAKIANYLKQLAVHYDTFGKERDFVTSSGKKIRIGGGDYGWKVDIKKETENLIEDIVSGRTIVKEPHYSQKGALHDKNDIGTTYVEIDLTKQHLWYYNSGKLVVQGAVVTGNLNKGYKTPSGIYSLKYKIRNAVLKGENYRSSVSYWMPFNNDIGIHDAPWRTQFGRDIYLTRGSHGCINASYWLAEILYNNITVGTPIVCYY